MAPEKLKWPPSQNGLLTQRPMVKTLPGQDGPNVIKTAPCRRNGPAVVEMARDETASLAVAVRASRSSLIGDRPQLDRRRLRLMDLNGPLKAYALS